MKKVFWILHRMKKNIYNGRWQADSICIGKGGCKRYVCAFMERRDMLYGELDVFSTKIPRNPYKRGSNSYWIDCNAAADRDFKADKKAQ